MADKLDEVAEAIKDFLPTQTYSGLKATAENCTKRWTAIRDIKQLQTHKVVVIPSRKQDQGKVARDPRLNIKLLMVSILIQQHVQDEDTATISPLRTLSSEIEEHLREARTMAGVGLWSVDDLVVSDDDLLTQNNLFITELVATYKLGG